jgi:hypothetical protein
MEPVQVKLYGLFKRTRKRYLIDAVLGLATLAAMFIAWFPLWPILFARIEKGRQNLGWVEHPGWMKVIIVFLDVLPWILAAAALFKCLEMFLVLRCFARKEGERARQGTGPKPSGPA